MAGLVRNIIEGILGSPALLHPREAQWKQGVLGALNAEIVTDCDGSGVVSLDIRGVFSHTVQVSGTIDGINWTLIPLRPLNVAAKLYVAAVAGAVPGSWIGACAGFRKVRALVTAYTSGGSTATLVANAGAADHWLDGVVATPITVTAAAGAIATLSIPSPGAGMRNYLTYIAINRIASTALTAAAAPVVVTTTNLPNAMAFSVPANAAPQGESFVIREDFAIPIMSTAQATATTIVGPVTPGVIWRISAAYYVAP
jgi:hypothetical protein